MKHPHFKDCYSPDISSGYRGRFVIPDTRVVVLKADPSYDHKFFAEHFITAKQLAAERGYRGVKSLIKAIPQRVEYPPVCVVNGIAIWSRNQYPEPGVIKLTNKGWLCADLIK